MARLLQWCCALFFVLLTVFSSSECRRSGGGRRVSIRTYTYSSAKSKPTYHSPSSSTSRRYPGYPIHQGQGGYAAFPGGSGPGPGGFGRFGTYEPTRGYVGSNTVDSSTLWLSLYSLTRDVNHYHFYYPNSSPAKNVPEKGSFSTQVGNMTCISIYNAKAVTKWATDTLSDLNKVFPKTAFPFNGNGTGKGVNFTVVPGEIVHNETLGVTCCGTARGIVNLAVLTSGLDADVNCVFEQFNMPFRKLTFIPINSASTNGTVVNNTSTTNGTAINANSFNRTATNTTVTANTNNATTTNTTITSNSNNGTETNTTVASNSNSTTVNTTVASNSNNTTANTTVTSNSNNTTATNTTAMSNPPISTSDNSTFPDARINNVLPTANSTTIIPIITETHIENIEMTTKAS